MQNPPANQVLLLQQQACLSVLMAIANAARAGSQYPAPEQHQINTSYQRHLDLWIPEFRKYFNVLVAQHPSPGDQALANELIMAAILTGYDRHMPADDRVWLEEAQRQLSSVMINRMPEIFAGLQPSRCLTGAQSEGRLAGQLNGKAL